MGFIVNSLIYENLKDKILAAVNLINSAIQSKKPILIRHHADTDGYSGAIAIERAILELLYKAHRRESDIFHYYRRSPSLAPFYDYTDATKDVSNFLNEVAKYEHKTPLIIVIDNGSTREDVLALQKIKIYGAHIIVIDHHPPSAENDSFIDVHINPHHVGSVENISAGMLCAEIAKMLVPDIEDLELLATLSGVSDKCTGTELEQYLKLSEKKGYTVEKIKNISECIEFETYYLGFLESRYMVDDLFFGDLSRQKKLLEMIAKEAAKRKCEQMNAVKKFTFIEDKKTYAVAKLDIARSSYQGEYPKRGKIVSMALDYARETMKKPAVAYGYGEDFLTFRCDRELPFDLNSLVIILKEKIPYGIIQGGGHAKAGTINFVQAARDDVLNVVDEYLDSNH
ncbi:MAG: DHH family phosphoesterase [Candidatus Woesearchaeota archaeon]